MKRTITLLFALLIAFAASAQSHMKFMGIPLNGTIDAFQQKLAAKRVRYDKEASARSSEGVRWFTGTFCGYKADISVYYDAMTDIVYSATVFIVDEEEDIIVRLYDDFVAMLDRKYPEALCVDRKRNGYPERTWFLPIDPDGKAERENTLGEIALWIFVSDVSDIAKYELVLDYTDRLNKEAYESSQEEDL